MAINYIKENQNYESKLRQLDIERKGKIKLIDKEFEANHKKLIADSKIITDALIFEYMISIRHGLVEKYGTWKDWEGMKSLATKLSKDENYSFYSQDSNEDSRWAKNFQAKKISNTKIPKHIRSIYVSNRIVNICSQQDMSFGDRSDDLEFVINKPANGLFKLSVIKDSRSNVTQEIFHTTNFSFCLDENHFNEFIFYKISKPAKKLYKLLPEAPVSPYL